MDLNAFLNQFLKPEYISAAIALLTIAVAIAERRGNKVPVLSAILNFLTGRAKPVDPPAPAQPPHAFVGSASPLPPMTGALFPRLRNRIDRMLIIRALKRMADENPERALAIKTMMDHPEAAETFFDEVNDMYGEQVGDEPKRFPLLRMLFDNRAAIWSMIQTILAFWNVKLPSLPA